MSSSQVDTRERILKETRLLMEQRRGQGVRLEDIAQAAQVSRQAIYLHFGSRTGLMIAAIRSLDDIFGLSERLRPVLTPQSGIRTLEAYIEFWGNYIPDIYGLAKAFMAAQETDEAATAAWKDRMDALYQGCFTAVQCLQRDGVLASEWTVDTAAEFFYAMLSISMWERLTIERGWSNDHYIQRIQQVLRKALVHEDKQA